MKYLITSDYHFNLNNRFEDTLNSCSQIEVIAKKEKPDFYVNLGDFLPTYRKYFFAKEAKCLATHFDNIQAKYKIIIVGNHDFISKDLSAVDWLRGVRITDSYFEKDDSGLKILFSHRPIKEAKVYKDFSLEFAESYHQIQKTFNADVMAFGDIHKPQIVNKIHPLVLIPGSIEKVSFAEREDIKFVWILETKNKTFVLKKYKLNTRIMKHLKIDLDTSTIFENDKQVASINVKDAVVKVDVIGKKEKVSRINYSKFNQKFKDAYKLDFNFIYSDTEDNTDRNDLSIAVDDKEILSMYCKDNNISNAVKKFGEKIISR